MSLRLVTAGESHGPGLVAILEGLPAGGLVMCHPGHVDAELKRLDPLTTIREREYAYFCSDAFVEALEAHGLTLN